MVEDADDRTGRVVQEDGVAEVVYSDLNRTNRSFVKRFSHGRRFQVATELLVGRRPRRVLDFGTGDGYFLGVILGSTTPELVVGYEPDPQMFEELKARAFPPTARSRVRITSSLAELDPGSFDTVVCLEVLEHLQGDARREALRRFRELLTDEGRAIISVPIEVGTSSVFKNLLRLMIGQAHANTTLRTMLRSLAGLPVARGTAPYIASHIGFDYRELEGDIVAVGLRVVARRFSPLPVFRSILNSQVFYVANKAPRSP